MLRAKEVRRGRSGRHRARHQSPRGAFEAGASRRWRRLDLEDSTSPPRRSRVELDVPENDGSSPRDVLSLAIAAAPSAIRLHNSSRRGCVSVGESHIGHVSPVGAIVRSFVQKSRRAVLAGCCQRSDCPIQDLLKILEGRRRRACGFGEGDCIIWERSVPARSSKHQKPHGLLPHAWS